MTPGASPLDTTLAALRAYSANGQGFDGPADQPNRASPQQLRNDSQAWHKLMAFASSHFVLQALAGPIHDMAERGYEDTEALSFIGALRDANRVRNQELKSALLEAAKALNAIGITACALKGATFLVAENELNFASWRFMSDLDLLVPEENLAACVAAITSLGFQAMSEEYDASTEAHYPPLISPCRTFSIELHTRLFGLGDYGVRPIDVVNEASLVNGREAQLLLPSLRHRIAHLLSHAQLHNRNHVVHRVVLKDVLDIIKLHDCNLKTKHSAEAIREVLDLYSDPAHRQAAESLLEVWHRCSSTPIDFEFSPAARAWADHAMRRLRWPRWRTLLNLPSDTLRMEKFRCRAEQGHLRRRLDQLADPTRVLGTVSRWGAKQQQRVWG